MVTLLQLLPVDLLWCHMRSLPAVRILDVKECRSSSTTAPTLTWTTDFTEYPSGIARLVGHTCTCSCTYAKVWPHPLINSDAWEWNWQLLPSFLHCFLPLLWLSWRSSLGYHFKDMIVAGDPCQCPLVPQYSHPAASLVGSHSSITRGCDSIHTLVRAVPTVPSSRSTS